MKSPNIGDNSFSQAVDHKIFISTKIIISFQSPFATQDIAYSSLFSTN